MDLFVELPDGTSKHVPVSLNCSVRAATQSCVLRAGMTPVASKLTEFSLAKKTDNQNPIIDVCWLDEGEKIKDQGGDSGSLNLILLKKYYATNSDLGLLVSSSILLRNLYSQFRRSYVSGLYRCTQSEAAQLSALIARAEFSLSELRPGSLQKTGRLEAIVPSFHYTSAGIEQDILKALSSVANLTETKAQEQFVHLVSKLDTFGLSLHTIMLVEIGGERREALFGVGPQHIRVMETHNLKTLMQWKAKDLTNHSFNDTTFSMNCGSESITMVTKQGHMISAYLSGMTRQQSPAPSKGSPPKKPLRPQRSVAAIMENGHGDGLSDRTSSTHIKSVDQQVKRYEGHLNKPRPLDPASQGPRPFRPPRPRHAPLRVTQSVPIRYTKPPTPTTSPSPLPAAGSREGERKPGTVYEVPFRKPRQGGGGGKPESPPQVPRVEEARYEVGNNKEVPPQPLGRLRKKNEEKGKPLAAGGGKIDAKGNPPHLPVLEEALYETTAIEEELPQPKVRPLLPPPPHNRKQLLKKKLLPAGLPNPDSNPPPPVVPPHAKKTHKSETEITVESGRDERPHSPVYDQPIQPPEYSEPEKTTASSHGRASKGKLHFPQPPSPFSPPPPSSPAPPPPHPHSSTETSQTPPPPKNPAPEPPIYDTLTDTLTPEEDMQEIEDVFGSKDLPMKVKYSCDTNPIYDTLAATELTSALNASNVTYHSFRNTLERRRSQQKPNVNQQKNKKKLPKAKSQPQVISSPIPLSSSPPLPPSPHDYANSELLSLLMKDMSPRASPTGQEESEPRREKPRKKSPSPPLTKAKSVSQIGVGGAKSGEKPLSVKPTPSCGYSRLEHFQNKPGVVPPPQTGPEPNRSGTTTDDDDEHEYAEVDQNPQRKTKLTKKLSDFEKASWVPVQNGGFSTPPPIPPLRGSDWEGKKLGPPKPPRARQRWEKKVERGSEGKSHKAVKRTDALRDYSSLMKDFRMFHVKLPTGIIHTDMANVRSEVGKLVRRLCVLLRVEEADYDHFSLYVEGTPYTILPEMTEEDGDEGGMFRRLRQKSPSRQDLFGSNRSFAVLSERSTNPILLDPSISFKSQGITTSRILALRPQTVLQGKMTRFQIRVPDWVRFHQCWLSTVQGTIVTTQTEAIKLAALQYQAYFRDRTEVNSVIGFCRSSDFLPLNYASVKGVEEKIYAEHQKLKGYTRLQAQDSYISTTCTSPAYNTIFFYCQEAKRKILRIQNTKLGPVLIGIGKDGAIRADFKTKEILDVWPYKVLKNWGYTENTFILEFDDRTYPLKTPQGRWMNALVDFHIESILGDMTTPPVTHQEMGGALREEEIVPVPHNRDDVDEIYSDLLSVRVQAQQWRAELANGKPSASSSPPSSPPTPHHLQLPSSIPDEQQSLPAIREPADYEEVEFGVPTPAAPLNSAAVYDVLRRDWEDDDAIYDTPTES